jgi:hypothetical protein
LKGFASFFLRSRYESSRITAVSPIQWQQIKRILTDALECDSEAERLALITVSCRDDANLKAELDALLAQHDHAWLDESFLLDLRTSLLRAFAPNE